MPNQSTSEKPRRQTKQLDAGKHVRAAMLPMLLVENICTQLGDRFRRTAYRPMHVVWMFIHQVLSHDNDCCSAVTRLNSLRTAAGQSKVVADNSVYCKARKRLPEALFEKLLQWSADRCGEAVDESWLWCNRVVEVIDGGTLTMADTAENQATYPQMRSQAPGVGFPIARMVGVFSLASAAAVQLAIGPYRGKLTGETSLFRTLLENVSRGCILLADRYYASFWLLAQGEMAGIDLVARAHHLRKVDFRKGSKYGRLDQLVLYKRPQKPKWMSDEEYLQYPETIHVRHLRYKIEQKGFRTKQVTLATTLTDADLYTAEKLAELYGRRWEVELHIRSVKTHMKAEHLKCKSPSMIRKEIHAHLIAYNLVRLTMVAASLACGLPPTRLSFERSRGELSEYAASVRSGGTNLEAKWESMLQSIREGVVGDLPGRKEPRELKRRPKQHKLMTKPRDPNRNRYAAAA